jgi:hypothetical protein
MGSPPSTGGSTHPQEGPANGYTILKHLGRLKNLEAQLRNIGCLASCPRRLGLWVFSPTPTFESLGPVYITDGDVETTKIFVNTTTLKGMIPIHMKPRRGEHYTYCPCSLGIGRYRMPRVDQGPLIRGSKPTRISIDAITTTATSSTFCTSI